MKEQIEEMKKLHFMPKIGIEMEFYYHGGIESLDIGYEVKEEDGEGQYEIIVPETFDLVALVDEVNNLKSKLVAFGADISPKPEKDGPGSSMHVNISLHDEAGNFPEKLLLQAVAGMLELVNESLIVFLPTKECYERIATDRNAPSKICWGKNNRTVLIRVPEKGKRIEHRLASNLADIEKVITVILYSSLYGIKNNLVPPEPIYGNAFDDIYRAEKIVTNIDEATMLFQKGRLVAIS